MPIRVCIASGAGTPGYHDVYHKALLDAFSAWALASDNKILFTLVPNPSQADIYCEWTGDPNKVMEAGRAVEGGLTKLSGQPDQSGDVGIEKARVTILTNRNGASLSDIDMRKVCLHEVGHALGLSGHSNNNTDIMFFTESPSVQPMLTVRDKTTLKRLYFNHPVLGAPNAVSY